MAQGAYVQLRIDQLRLLINFIVCLTVPLRLLTFHDLNYKMVAIVDFHISTTFDAVNYETLVCRLSIQFGNTGYCISSYLFGRYLYVRVRNSSSSIVAMITGVLQESILGLILLTSYIAPIDRLIDNFNIGYQNTSTMQLFAALLASTQTKLNQHELQCCELQVWFWRDNLFSNQTNRMIHSLGRIKISTCATPVYNKLSTPDIKLDSTDVRQSRN